MALIAKYLLSTYAPKVDTSSMFGVYIVLIWIPIMVLNLVEGRSLPKYLKSAHPAKWEELTTILGFGPGFRNGFRSLNFILSDDDLGDPEVARRKTRYRGFLKFTIAAFVGFPIVSVLLSL